MRERERKLSLRRIRPSLNGVNEWHLGNSHWVLFRIADVRGQVEVEEISTIKIRRKTMINSISWGEVNVSIFLPKLLKVMWTGLLDSIRILP